MRPLRALVVAHTTSAAGNAATQVAVPLHVLATGGSGVQLGIASAAAVVPVVVGGLFGGTIVDRVGYRRTSVASDVVGAVTIAAVPLLAGTVGLPFWGLVLLLVATGLLDAPGQAARHAMLPELAAAQGVPLVRATGSLNGAERLAQLVGVAATAALVGWLGALPVLWLDAVTFALSATLVLLAVPHASAAARPEGAYLRRLREGLAVVRRDGLLRAVVLLVLATNAFDTALTVLLPLVARDTWHHPAAFGWVSAVFGVGAAVGALQAHRLTGRWSRRRVFAFSFLLAGSPRFLLLATGPSLELTLVVVLACGLAAGAINPVLGAVQLERVAPRMRARVAGLVAAGAWAGMPAGSLLAGWGADRLGVVPVLWTVGAAYLLVTIAPFVGRSWKDLDRPARQAADVAG
ncbi:MFS transporter [Kineococcus sp. NPDC059986]|uniref:MFS transporter n=1 Tax=Kineococcus sp. NPDC059986 TaxID=3155538 RepID=UPI0034506A4F